MWKKRFLSSSQDDAMQSITSPLNLESKKSEEENHMREQEGPPAAHQSSSKMKIASATPTGPISDPQWTMVPVQQFPLHNIYSNPINHMHQQQMDYEMYRRQQNIHDESQQLNNFSTTSDTTNIMTRATMLPNPFPSVPLCISQEMVDYNVMQRYQHERYLQQAREMQVADVHAEQVEMFTKVQEVARNNPKRGSDEGRRGLKRSNSYRAVLKNGELVEAEDGYLMVTHNNLVVNNVTSPMNMSITTTQPDSPLNLSVKDQRTSSCKFSNTDSDFIDTRREFEHSSVSAMNLVTKDSSVQLENTTKASGLAIFLPPAPGVKVRKLLPKLAPKPSAQDVASIVKPKIEPLKEDIKPEPAAAEPFLPTSLILPQDIKTLFPQLKTTTTGSLVLWNFLWALLKDDNYKTIVSWISVSSLKFCIVNPTLLATLWGQVKENPSMDWPKIKKILELYLRKNLISPGLNEYQFTFNIVHKSFKENLSSGKL